MDRKNDLKNKYPIGYNVFVATPKELVEYLDESGDSPFSSWLSNLRDSKGRAVIRKRLNRIRLGNLGDYKSVGDGVYEIRIHFGPGYRIYFGVDQETIVVLLAGGDKSTQIDDIRRSKGLWKEYWR
ncbi:MAG: type II toxin-antitoxin system RelE/ParE family toxin [Bdellovibrionales bacterium]|nr:type II toxin-antitoxin system RelE/ParE family toxin [Bdellovibrionales bacterium]